MCVHTTLRNIKGCENIFYTDKQVCAYADVIAIMTRTNAQLTNLLEKFAAGAKNIGLIVNELKTKYMLISSVDSENPKEIQLGKLHGEVGTVEHLTM